MAQEWWIIFCQSFAPQSLTMCNWSVMQRNIRRSITEAHQFWGCIVMLLQLWTFVLPLNTQSLPHFLSYTHTHQTQNLLPAKLLGTMDGQGHRGNRVGGGAEGRSSCSIKLIQIQVISPTFPCKQNSPLQTLKLYPNSFSQSLCAFLVPSFMLPYQTGSNFRQYTSEKPLND